MTKFNKLFGVATMLTATALFSPSTVHACAVCYGDPASPVSKGLNWAIFALAGIVVGVLSGIVGFFVYTNRNASAGPVSPPGASSSLVSGHKSGTANALEVAP